LIIFFGHGGRLGNQLFQISFIESIRRGKELVLTTQMIDVHRFLAGLRRYVNYENYFVINFIDKLLHPLMYNLLVKTGMINGYIETDAGYREYKGLFPLIYCRGYFQSSRYFVGAQIARTQPRKKHLSAARDSIAMAEGRTPLFVHVRHGDYGVPGILGPSSPLLPPAFYHQGVQELLTLVPSPHIYFLGDDPEWCEKEFSGLSHKTISRGSMYEDLALMALCDGGVISNSTFAWWGAYLCKKRAPIIGPKYWLGWRNKEWHPQWIGYEGFRFIEVPDDGRSGRQN
jgi:hypothetical protein